MELIAESIVRSTWLLVVVFVVASVSAQILIRINSRIRALTLQSESATRFHALDALRGYLALGVFVSHIAVTWVYRGTGVWMYPNTNFYTLLGQTCVALFFMMTGFLFWTKLLETKGTFRWQNFVIGRVWRIYPLYVFMLCFVVFLTFALQDWTARESLLRTIKQCLRWLTFSMPPINQLPETPILIAFVAWSLRYEWLFYGVFLISMVIMAKTRKDWLSLSVGCCIMAVVVIADPKQRFFGGHCITFLGGIIAAYSIRQASVVVIMQNVWMRVLATLSLVYVLFFAPVATAFVPFVCLTFFFTSIASGNDLWGNLKPASALWLGEISYSVYLLHGLVLWFFGQFVFGKLPADSATAVTFVSMMLGTTVCIVIVSSCTHLFIEKPGIEAGKRVAAWLYTKITVQRFDQT
jgi:peptidoglycan/LPS O-acetylase OafA/YrhL